MLPHIVLILNIRYILMKGNERSKNEEDQNGFLLLISYVLRYLIFFLSISSSIKYSMIVS